ncbi:ribonuclease G [uncultured Umboniibacter sp.]|uniref:ribonuclease G n=1 Tax=uncultured Umboniibacter sp. TaxID=1798917 RepID=UPI0026382FD3|nr:ribonuclease G [uncultured Umboniibacter sp.]
MSNEILINITPLETRVAIVEDGLAHELYLERANHRGLVGNIYVGKVQRVLPGMQAAFVDIGLEKAAFIHAQDVVELDQHGMELRKPSSATPPIRELLHEGQRIAVQVLKDPIATKGARVTTHLSLSSRYLVYMPKTDHVGVSQRIDDEIERERLKLITEQCRDERGGGFIIRTVAEGADERELASDAKFLQKLWLDIEHQLVNTTQKFPRRVYQDLPLYLRVIRDYVSPNIDRIRIDDNGVYEELMGFTNKYFPDITARLSLNTGQTPLFDLFGVEDEIHKALKRTVQLKSGGHIVIDETEAMTTVDVNTGGYVGGKTLEETIFKTNLEAVSVIARQLRLRNIGGIIILDFIDMKDAEHRRTVHRAFAKVMAKDSVKSTITGISEIGLIELTRKRTRESLEQQVCDLCSVCDGRGVVKSAESVCYEVFREILRDARQYEGEKLVVVASSAVIDRLLDEESNAVADIEQLSGKLIEFRHEPLYSQEQYDIILV